MESIGQTINKLATKMEYHETLHQYYLTWFRDCHDSAVFCRNKGDIDRQKQYLQDAKNYWEVIVNNWDKFFN